MPKDLPEFIEVDVAALEVGHSLHISEITLPEGVTSVDLTHGSDHDLAVVTISKTRGASDAESESEGEDAGEE